MRGVQLERAPFPQGSGGFGPADDEGRLERLACLIRRTLVAEHLAAQEPSQASGRVEDKAEEFTPGPLQPACPVVQNPGRDPEKSFAEVCPADRREN